jgi:hypothetical protein
MRFDFRFGLDTLAGRKYIIRNLLQSDAMIICGLF